MTPRRVCCTSMFKENHRTAFAAIRDQAFAEQAAGDEDCDYLFDIPVEMDKSVNYRHDADVPGLSGDVFEVLARPQTPSFFKRLFGGR